MWHKWKPKIYLKDFYSEIQPDEIATIVFLTKVAKRIPPQEKILEFGSGPTLHHAFPFIPYTSEYHIADYLKSNLIEISNWIKNKKNTHNWDDFINYTLKCEGNKNPTAEDIKKRKLETKKKITKYIQVDASKPNPLGKNKKETYSTVVSCYCADSATNNHRDFEVYIKHITSLVKPGGIFILACLRKARYYKVGTLSFPSANVDEQLVRKILKKVDFSPKSIKLKIVRLPSHREQGYTSIILAYATKQQSK